MRRALKLGLTLLVLAGLYAVGPVNVTHGTDQAGRSQVVVQVYWPFGCAGFQRDSEDGSSLYAC